MNLEYEKKVNQFNLSKYFVISLGAAIIGFILIVIFNKLTHDNPKDMFIFSLAMLNLFVFATYIFSMYYISTVFFRNAFKEDQITYVNSGVIIPVYNLRHLFKLMEMGGLLSFLLSILTMGMSPYIVLYFFMNMDSKNQINN